MFLQEHVEGLWNECNFSAEEAVIREVWMGEKICLGGRGKMSGDLVPSWTSFLGLEEMNGCTL